MICLYQIPVSGFVTIGYVSQDISCKFTVMAKINGTSLLKSSMSLACREERNVSSHYHSWKAPLLSAAQQGCYTPSPAAAARLACWTSGIAKQTKGLSFSAAPAICCPNYVPTTYAGSQPCDECCSCGFLIGWSSSWLLGQERHGIKL